ncbi:MAG: hypothetical protein JO323_08390 [Acidobacteriia bacterium]|nr:hypothetical protein [Terriglobia bacterium]
MRHRPYSGQPYVAAMALAVFVLNGKGADAQEYRKDIPANNGEWTDTGFRVLAGQTYEIDASGTIIWHVRLPSLRPLSCYTRGS